MKTLLPVLRRLGRFVKLTVCCFETAMLGGLLAIIGLCYVVGLAAGATHAGRALLGGALLISGASIIGYMVYQMLKGIATAGRTVGRWTREQWRAAGEAGR